jgi:LysM repeat protein
MKNPVSSRCHGFLTRILNRDTLNNSQFIISKEGVVKKFVNSPLRLTVFAIILALALTACVRPLQEEEPATPTPNPAQVFPTAEPEQPAPAEPEDAGATATPAEGEGEAESGTGEEATPPTEGETEAPAGSEGSTEQPATEGETTLQPQPVSPSGERIHIVQQGENLFRIGLQYGVPYQTLAAYNGIPNVNLIYPGQQIRIPGG